MISTSASALVIDFDRRPTNYQPNLLTESRQNFSLLEKRITVLVINQLKQVADQWQMGQNVSFLIPYKELTDHHHEDIARAAKTLNTKQISYQTVLPNGEKQFEHVVPFPRVANELIAGRLFLRVEMYASVVPLFIDLGRVYTKYNLEVMMSLASSYSQRLYEIIMRFYCVGQKSFTYEVDKLRDMMGYPRAHSYNDFKKKALQKAQDELREKGDLILEWKPSRKDGKRILELRFDVRSIRPQDRVEEDQQAAAELPISQLIVRLHNYLTTKYNFTSKQIQEILGSEHLRGEFMRLDREIEHNVHKGVRNPTAYIAKSLGWGGKKTTKSKTASAPK